MEFFSSYVSPIVFSYIKLVLDSTRLSEGAWVRKFEASIEHHLGVKNIVAVNSGTSALHLALVAAGVKQGDEVILPPLTFIATGLAVLYCGATPVFCDIEKDGCIDIYSARSKVTNKTKAIIGVNWAGHPCNIEGLESLGKYTQCKIIIDAAQSFGTGVGGDFTCLSFQATKHLSTGDGGAVICKSDEDYELVRRLSWFGIDKEKDLPNSLGERVYNLDRVGYKYHMNNIAAAIGLANLTEIDQRLARRKKIAGVYRDNLKTVEPIHFKGVYWAYPVKTPNVHKFSDYCANRGIPVSIIHRGIDRNSIFGGLGEKTHGMGEWEIYVTHLPVHHEISVDDALRICNVINKFVL